MEPQTEELESLTKRALDFRPRLPRAGANSTFQETETKQTWKGQPDPTRAEHAGTQDVEPDSANLIDSHALFQPGTTGAGNTLSLERLMIKAARANILRFNNPRLCLGGTFEADGARPLDRRRDEQSTQRPQKR